MVINPTFIVYPDGRWEKVENVKLPEETAKKRETRMFNAARATVGGDVEMVACLIPGVAMLVNADANMVKVPPPHNALASKLTRYGVSLRGPVVLAEVS